jgi:hypothetical protein
MDRFDVADIKSGNPVFMCEGCVKIQVEDWTATGWKCPVYADPLKVYAIRVFGKCPMNQKASELSAKDKQRIRVGQQKQRSRR